MSYMFDPAGSLERLVELEKQWGGTPQERLDGQLAAYRMEKGLIPLPENIAASGENAAGTQEATSPANESAAPGDARDDSVRPPPSPISAGSPAQAAPADPTGPSRP
jgi:penicillin-binding protein 2